MTRVQHPESETKIAQMFDRIAPRYDLLNRLLSMRQDQRWRRHLVKRIPKQQGGTYLDVATGTGDVLLAAMQARQEYEQFIGVDISQEMLRLADEKLSRSSQNSKATLKPMSAEKLDIPSTSVDCLSISFGLRNVVNRDQALREFSRVLKGGGTLLILEFFIPKTGLLAALFQLYFNHILPLIGGLLSDKSAYRYLPQSVASFYSLPELKESMSSAGLEKVNDKAFLWGSCRLVQATKL